MESEEGLFEKILATDNERWPVVLSNDENAQRFELLWAGDESVRESIIEGNMHWVERLVETMDNQSDIPLQDLVLAGREGLAAAVDKFTDPEFKFAPDETLKNGYAIWWVRLHLVKFAQERDLEYLAASNGMRARNVED